MQIQNFIKIYWSQIDITSSFKNLNLFEKSQYPLMMLR